MFKKKRTAKLKKDICRAVGHNFNGQDRSRCERCEIKNPNIVTIDSYPITPRPKIKYSDIQCSKYDILNRAKERGK